MNTFYVISDFRFVASFKTREEAEQFIQTSFLTNQHYAVVELLSKWNNGKRTW